MTAEQQDVLAKTEAHVRDLLGDDASGHDWWHIARVRATALTLAQREQADTYVVELAALLHDVADWKFHDGDVQAGPRVAAAWLSGLQVPRPTIDHVSEIIASLSFKGAGVATPMRTLEGQIVQDADRLDAIGAIGIARTFAYGGHAGQPMHDPELPATMHASFADYQQKRSTTINHFHEKLLLLKDRMNTPAARHMAADRHAFMEAFLREFDEEWRGVC